MHVVVRLFKDLQDVEAALSALDMFDYRVSQIDRGSGTLLGVTLAYM